MEHIRRIFLILFSFFFAAWAPADASPGLTPAAAPGCAPLVYDFNGSAGTDPPGWTGYNAEGDADWALDGSGSYTSAGEWDDFTSVSAGITYADFRMTARMKREVDLHRTNGLFIRGVPLPLGTLKLWKQGYLFGYQNGGDVGVWRLDSGVPTELQQWTPSPAVQSGEYNLLQVDAIGSQMKFKMNGVVVALIDDAQYAAGEFGLGFYLTSEDPSGSLLVDEVVLSCNPSLLDPIVYLPAVFQESLAQALHLDSWRLPTSNHR